MSKHTHAHHHQSPSKNTQTAADNSSLERRAYEIYREKGGSALDNWLEAERSLNK